MLQVTFVSFAAPVATLALMDKDGASRCHIAATLAMVLAMAQANVAFPMAALNLDLGLTLIASITGGLIAALSTYHIFARALPKREDCTPPTTPHTDPPPPASTPLPHKQKWPNMLVSLRSAKSALFLSRPAVILPRQTTIQADHA